MVHRGKINIGDTDEKADWIKSEKNRKSEKKIHDELAKKHEEEQQQDDQQGA